MKIKKNDNVLVISGKDRGRKGKVSKIFTKERRVLVEGLNIQKKHRRPKRQGQKGEILEIPAPLAISKVKIVCPKCTKPARVGYKISGSNKYRACKKCGEAI